MYYKCYINACGETRKTKRNNINDETKLTTLLLIAATFVAASYYKTTKTKPTATTTATPWHNILTYFTTSRSRLIVLIEKKIEFE
jgi:hypothetical protein